MLSAGGHKNREDGLVTRCMYGEGGQYVSITAMSNTVRHSQMSFHVQKPTLLPGFSFPLHHKAYTLVENCHFPIVVLKVKEMLNGVSIQL